MSDLLFSNEILPLFSQIKYDAISEDFSTILSNNKKVLSNLINKKNDDSFISDLEELFIKISNAWSPISHLNSVLSSGKLRSQHADCLAGIVDYNLLIEQDQKLFNKYKAALELILKDNNPNNYQKKLLENKIRDAKLAGVELEDESKNKYKQVISELSQDTTVFSNNVLDCTDNWSYHISEQDLLKGIPQEIILIAQDRAKSNDQDGWLFGLDAPTYIAILKYADNRELRAAFHYAFATRASKKGPHDEKYDNSKVLFEILSKRHKSAKLLGFSNYAEYSLATKMVNKPEQVIDFLNNLVSKSKVYAEKEWEELRLFAKNHSKIDDLKPWDVAYFSELQKTKMFNISDDDLKAYFPLKKVLNGLFVILNKIYKIDLKVNTKADRWHPDVICYDILNNSKKVIGHIYIDLYARLHKRSGAWMDECRVRCNTNNINQLPVAFLTCNFTKPSKKNPALLTHNDVVTLFHEFGHCLHHLLTSIEYPSISGINGVPWDAVELPSQFHENWCWQKESLPLISEHYKTGEPLPEKLLQQLLKQKNYQSGMFLLRQITFALFDFKLHHEFHPDKGVAQVQEVLDYIRKDIAILPYADYDKFQNSFSHIFSGGYAAGYYSYLWAEVLAANCFDAFKQQGVFSDEAGKSFLDTILSKGGSIDFNKAVPEFCGFEINTDLLLNHHGIKCN